MSRDLGEPPHLVPVRSMSINTPSTFRAGQSRGFFVGLAKPPAYSCTRTSGRKKYNRYCDFPTGKRTVVRNKSYYVKRTGRAGDSRRRTRESDGPGRERSRPDPGGEEGDGRTFLKMYASAVRSPAGLRALREARRRNICRTIRGRGRSSGRAGGRAGGRERERAARSRRRLAETLAAAAAVLC